MEAAKLHSPSPTGKDLRVSASTADTLRNSFLGSVEKTFDELDGKWEGQFEKLAVAPYQNGITHRMVRKLVDWLLGVCWNFSVDEAGLFLAVALLQGYLRQIPVDKKSLQAVGATCLFVACKYNQTRKLKLREVLELCGGAYAREELLTIEEQLLQLCGFDLEAVHAHSYLTAVLHGGLLPADEAAKVCFWLEVDLFRDPTGLHPRELLTEVVTFVRGGGSSALMQGLLQMARELPFKTLQLKYMSHFDTGAYLSGL
jgi:hypothetical protein